MCINVMLVQSCGAVGVEVMKSTIYHPMAGVVSSAQVKLGNRNVVGYYSGTLFYQILYWRQHDDRMFGEGELSVSVKTLKLILPTFQRG